MFSQHGLACIAQSTAVKAMQIEQRFAHMPMR
jgi:hypothetical protein